VTQKKATLRGMSAKTWSLTYTDDGYLDQVTNPDGEVTKHEYLSDGRLKKITLRATELSNKATRELFYEDTDNNHAYVSGKMPYLRRTLDKKEPGTVIADFEYELDKAGVRLSMKDKDGKYWAYGYDPRYQLRSETKWSQKVNGSRQYQYGWLYDANGNRLTQHHDGVPTDYVYGGNNEMLEAGSVAFTYDHFGNTKTKLEGGNTTTYNWDDEGHLLGVDYPGTTNDDSHEYDGDGRRPHVFTAFTVNVPKPGAHVPGYGTLRQPDYPRPIPVI
jgi:YD repeat-containing protein